jgi:hypothetical protein
LLEWHAAGRQWLAPAEPDSTWSFHPTSGGYTDFAVLGMYALRGWGESYHTAWQKDKLVLALDIDRSLRLERSLRLSAGRLHIRSQLTNTGSAALSCAWGAALQLSVPVGSSIAISNAAGERTIPWDALPGAPGQALTLTGDQLPASAWRVLSGGPALCQGYKGIPLERLSFARIQAGAALSVDLRSETIALEPGRSVTFQQELWIEEK